MRPLALPTLVVLSMCSSSAGCDKGDAAGSAGATSVAAPSGSAPVAAATAPSAVSSAPAAPSAATQSATASAGPPAPKCPPGLTGNAVPAYCIKLPAGYTVKDARLSPTKGSIAYDTGTATDALMVSYDSTSVAEQSKDVESELKFGGDKIEKKGDLPGGNKWYVGSHADYERVVTLVKGQPPVTLKCSFAYKPKSAPPQAAIDACKSIVIP